VNVDGRGTPLRSKAFHDFSYGNLRDPGCLEDHIACIRQLADRHDFITLDRVGIMGHSAGGYATVRALAAHPDFFHVGVSSAGNHDQRGYGFVWTEKHQGPVGESDYPSAANKNFVDAITGKLLLATGEMDDNVHPALSYQLIDALIKADKDFELIVLPNENHGTMTAHPYFLRRAMGFLHAHLVSAAQACASR
jgi:dipeptidyl aminopeptidase/acylaminoacyl peptidase